MTSKSLLESINPKGHLEIIKRYSDGVEETVLNDHNIITIGMGITLAYLFENTDTTNDASDFAAAYFQIGNGSALMVSSLTQLGDPINNSEYGDSDLTLSTVAIGGTGGAVSKEVAFINPTYISRNGTKIIYSLGLQESACNLIAIDEIGLYTKNPTGSTHPFAYLCAYRSFPAITKTDAFALIFKWTIEF